MRMDKRIMWIGQFNHRIMLFAFLLCTLATSFAQAVHASPSASNASASKTSSPSTSSTKTPPSAQLGKINVKATRELIKTLRVVKVAMHESYSDSPDKANVMVCRIITGHGHVNVEERMGAVLECGSNSWFTWKRENCRNSNNMADCTADISSTAYKRKGAWHSMRELNFKQLAALRQLLKTLPAPGKGQVVLVDAAGKTVIKTRN